MQRFIWYDCQVNKQYMMRLFFISFVVITMVSCKKKEPKPNGVMIRVENLLSFNLDSVKLVYDTSHYDFGTILSGNATIYVFFKSMPDGPAITADSSDKKILAGHFIPPNSYPTPILTNGKYTLEIFPDSTLFYHYGAKYIEN